MSVRETIRGRGRPRKDGHTGSGTRDNSPAPTQVSAAKPGSSTALNRQPGITQLTEASTKDLSVLRAPIELGLTGAKQIFNAMKHGTQEVINNLTNECDIIYECKLCRAMFRSMANFMAHKRVYCTESHQAKKLPFVNQMLEPETLILLPETAPEIPDVKPELDERMEIVQNEIQKMSYPVFGNMEARQTAKSFYEKVAEHEQMKQQGKTFGSIEINPIRETQAAVTQILSGYSSATQAREISRRKQNLQPDRKVDDGMLIIDGEATMIVQPEATKDAKGHHVSPIYSDASDGSDDRNMSATDRLRLRKDCDVDQKKCFKCNSVYSSVKSLARHMRALHSSKRVYYPCLYCPGIFSAAYSVVRHIVRAHGKSLEKAEKLKSQIKEHSFTKEVEEFDIGDEMKATNPRNWMMKKEPEIDPGTELRTTVSTENIIDKPRKGSVKTKKFDPDDAPRPGNFRCVCGKQFSSSWNQAQHEKSCKMALREAKKNKLESALKSVTPSSPVKSTASPAKVSNSPKKFKCHKCFKYLTTSWNYAQHIKKCLSEKKRIRNRSKSSPLGLPNLQGSPTKSSWGPLRLSAPNSPVKFSSSSDVSRSPGKGNKSPVKSSNGRNAVGSACKVTVKAVKLNLTDETESSEDDNEDDDDEEVVIKPRFVGSDEEAEQEMVKEKNKSKSKGENVGAEKKSKNHKSDGIKEEKMDAGFLGDPSSPPKLSDEELEKIRQIVDEDELRCLKCKRQYCTVSYLHRHAVRHLGWKRFKCKMCKFTAYNRSECTTHLRKVHANRTEGVRDMNQFIHDLEPDKGKQEPPSILTRVERCPRLERSNSSHSSNGDYNISTRRNQRVFDTNPYRRPDDEDDDSISSDDEGVVFETKDNKRKRRASESQASITDESSKRSRMNHSEGEDVSKSPAGRRKVQRPLRAVNGFAIAEETNFINSPPISVALQGKISVKPAPILSPSKMSQKIEDLTQSDVDKVLQMVQGNKKQVVSGSKSDEVVILVVGDNKSMSPVKATATYTPGKAAAPFTPASPIKLTSVASSIVGSQGGRAVMANLSTANAINARGTPIVSMARSPIKILPKSGSAVTVPVTNGNSSPKSSGNSILDKLVAAKFGQHHHATNVAKTTIVAKATTGFVTAGASGKGSADVGNKSPRKQNSSQK